MATLAAHPGTPVTTTIDPAAQHAAEAALAGENKSAALVAVNASTGDDPGRGSANSGGFDQAIDGGFPPGSTFKVITSTALITHGLTPQSAASCPGTATVDGEVFHNAEGEAPVSTMLQAFTESCNTAFIQLATGHLTAPDLPAAATMFGLGRSLHLGLISFDGSVPQPSDEADLAATAIGQGRVLMSPLAMAMVAAAADTGTVRSPQPSRSGAARPGGSRRLRQRPREPRRRKRRHAGHQPAAGERGQRPAQDDGVGGGQRHRGGPGPAGRHLRQDRDRPVRVDHPAEDRRLADGLQWHIAFACLVVDSTGNGGPTCGPIVAKFLHLGLA